MDSEINTNKLFFDIRKNEIKPYDVGQVLSIKDGIAFIFVILFVVNGMALFLLSFNIFIETLTFWVAESTFLLLGLPMVVKNHTFFSRLKRKILQLYCSYVLFLRGLFTLSIFSSFMIRYFSILTTITFIYLNKHYPQAFNAQTCAMFLGFLGSQMFMLDFIGSKITEHLFTSSNPILSLTSLLITREKTNNVFIRFGSTSILWGTFVGTGKMTVAGRVALTTALASGLSWLGNEHFNRVERSRTDDANRTAATARADADRAAATARADADRAAATARADADKATALYKIQMESYTKRYQIWQKSPTYSRGLPPRPPVPPTF